MRNKDNNPVIYSIAIIFSILSSIGVTVVVMLYYTLYNGGPHSSYYLFVTFLNSLIAVLFIQPAIFWFYGGKHNPYFLFILFVPELFFTLIGFPLYTLYLIPFLAQTPLLGYIINRFYQHAASFETDIKRTKTFKRLSKVTVVISIPVALICLIFLFSAVSAPTIQQMLVDVLVLSIAIISLGTLLYLTLKFNSKALVFSPN